MDKKPDEAFYIVIIVVCSEINSKFFSARSKKNYKFLSEKDIFCVNKQNLVLQELAAVKRKLVKNYKII